MKGPAKCFYTSRKTSSCYLYQALLLKLHIPHSTLTLLANSPVCLCWWKAPAGNQSGPQGSVGHWGSGGTSGWCLQWPLYKRLKLLLHCCYSRSPLLFNIPGAHDLLSLDLPVTRGETGAGAVSIACGNRDQV